MAQTRLDRSLFRIEPLHIDHLPRFASFACGGENGADFVNFLKDDAYRLHEAHVSFTYLGFLELADQEAEEFVGYISLITDALTLDPEEKADLPSVRFGVLPALKVARLATDLKAKNQIRGIGTALMAAAYTKAVQLAQSVAIRFLVVDAVEDAVKFYEKLGFIRNTSKTYLKKKMYTSMRLDLFAPKEPTWVFEEGATEAPPEDPPNPPHLDSGGRLDNFFQEHLGKSTPSNS